jgi:hypothetical protein
MAENPLSDEIVQAELVNPYQAPLTTSPLSPRRRPPRDYSYLPAVIIFPALFLSLALGNLADAYGLTAALPFAVAVFWLSFLAAIIYWLFALLRFWKLL